MSLLSIINAKRLRNNQSSVSSAFANPDTGVQQDIALLQDVGDELAERNFWQALDIAATIAGTGAQTLFPFPSGFAGMSPGLQFQSTLYPTMPLVGPVSDEQMATFKALPVAPLQPIWRVINGNFEFYPAPVAGEVYTYNYYSSFWIANVLGTPIPAWTADTDVSLIDEKLPTSGLEWRWLKAKGLDYAEEFRRYENRIARADGRQDKTRVVSMSSKRIPGGATWPGVLPIYDGSASEGSDFGFM